MSRYSLEDLIYLMQRLRDPQDGCPWDREQDFATIVPHTIEESYELADAIASNDFKQIKEELGDVLFQVVFYSQLGRERGEFEFSDVVQAVVTKLLRRHPHVFPDGTLNSRAGDQTVETSQVKQTWEAIKAEERGDKQQHGVLDDIPVALPAMTRALKLQKRAARVGFDWDDTEQVLAQLNAELKEFSEAKASQCAEHIEEEFGDVLFCLVNIARHMKLDPEVCLRSANRKFESRFRYIESALKEVGSSPEQASLEQMDALWEEAKTTGL